MALMVGTVLKEKKQNHASCDFLNIYQFRKKKNIENLFSHHVQSFRNQ